MAGTIHLKMATIVYKMGLPETENEAPPRELGRLHGLEPREEVDVAAVEVVSAVPLQARPAQPTARGRPKATNWCHPDCRQLATKRHTRPTSAKCDTCVAFEPPCTHSCRSLPPASSQVVNEWRSFNRSPCATPFPTSPAAPPSLSAAALEGHRASGVLPRAQPQPASKSPPHREHPPTLPPLPPRG